MTRVLYIAPEYPASGENAAQVRANALLPRLRELTELRVLAFPPPGMCIKTTNEPGVYPVARASLGSARLACLTLSPRPRSFFRYDTPEARQTLQHLLDEFQPEVVHFDSIGTLALLDMVLTMRPRPKIVAHTHDAVSQLYRRQLQTGSLWKRILTWVELRKYLAYERHELRRVDAVIVDSPEDAEYLTHATGGGIVATIPLGVDLQAFREEGPCASLIHPALVFSGSMAVRQSADAAEFLAREIMPCVWDQHPDCHLYLVGNRPLPEIQALASDRVHVTGYVEDLAAYLRAATVYVCPLRIGSGMRTRVVEALACGAPMVASPMALRGLTNPRNGGSTPWIVAVTPENYASAINAILSGDKPDFSNCASAYAQQNYSWSAVARSIVEIYCKLGAE